MSDYIEKSIRVNDAEEIAISSHDRSYDIGVFGDNMGEYVTASSRQLHELADFIKKNIPEPSLLEDAVFIKAVHVRFADTRSLAKVGSYWFDTDGKAYTEDEVLRYYDRMEIIV